MGTKKKKQAQSPAPEPEPAENAVLRREILRGIASAPVTSLREAMEEIAEILYPEADPDGQWNGGDVCEAVNNVLQNMAEFKPPMVYDADGVFDVSEDDKRLVPRKRPTGVPQMYRWLHGSWIRFNVPEHFG
jgi:hypothetical protein